jgi:phage tail-like protein
MPGRAAADDPYRAYNWKLEIKGVPKASFTACTGLGISVEAIRYREGGQNQIVHRLPGPVQYEDVTLHYGLTDSQDLFRWLLTGVQGNVERKDVSIIMLRANGSDEAMRWNLFETWPSAWRGAALDAMSREVAIERLTLVYERLEIG